MSNSFSVHSNCPTSGSQIKNYLFSKLKPIIEEKRPIIILCIGIDRSTGDSLGPLLGYKLKSSSLKSIYVYGTLENPIYAENISKVYDRININFKNPFIIAINSSLGDIQNVGKVFIKDGPLKAGSSLNKDIPEIGDMNIKGIVNISGSLEFMILQNTRLFCVMQLAECIYSGVKDCIKNIERLNNEHSKIEIDLI